MQQEILKQQIDLKLNLLVQFQSLQGRSANDIYIEYMYYECL